MNSTISCILLSYNNGPYLKQAIESVLAQTRMPDEIVVADDCSSDGSQEVIRDFASRYHCIKPIFREKNIGVTRNRDLALRAAKSDFVTFLDGDDTIFPEKIERESCAIAGDLNAVAFSTIVIINGKRDAVRIMDTSPIDGQSSKEIVHGFSSRSVPIPRDFLLSKRLFLDTGGFRLDLPLYEDWDLKIRLALKGVRWIWSRSAGTIYRRAGMGLSAYTTDQHTAARRAVLMANRDALIDQFGESEFKNILERTCPVREKGRKEGVSATRPIDLYLGRIPPIPYDFVPLEDKASRCGPSSDENGIESRPLISIVTPILNCVDLVREAIESVRRQDVESVEHIFVDGGSTDGTLDLLREFPHLKVIEAPGSGIYEALNKGLEMARGEVLGWLNSDDYYAPDLFGDIAELFNSNPQLDMIQGGSVLFSDDEDGKPKIIRSTIAACETRMCVFNVTFGNPAINARFFRRSLYVRVGAFDERFKITADREWLLRCLSAGVRDASLNRVVCWYRSHPKSVTFKANREHYGWPSDDLEYVGKMLKQKSILRNERWILKAWHSFRAFAALRGALNNRQWRRAAKIFMRGMMSEISLPVALMLYGWRGLGLTKLKKTRAKLYRWFGKLPPEEFSRF